MTELRHLNATRTAYTRYGRPDIIISSVGPPTPARPLYAGHVPNRVLVGLNAPEDKPSSATLPRPQYSEALAIVGGSVYVRRTFDSGTFTTSAASAMVDPIDALGQLPVFSFKAPSNRWDLVANGDYDGTWMTQWRQWAVARRNSGKGPALAAMHHEPDGDGPTGDRLVDLGHWADMQEHCVDFFSGWRTGTYNPAEDVSDIMPWTTIANGHWWGLRFPKPDRIAAAYPASLIAKMTRSGGPMMADFYDANPPNAASPPTAANRADCLTETNLGYAPNADRTSRQMLGFIQWARANGVKSIGCGEYGCVTPSQFDAVWNLVAANRDIWSILLHFNNFANSRWDWRLLPAGYPVLHPPNSKGLVDLGGDTLSAAYVTRFQATRDASTSPQYTSPL